MRPSGDARGDLRYCDLGQAQGRAVPQPDNGSSQPARALTFDHDEDPVTLGIRTALRAY